MSPVSVLTHRSWQEAHTATALSGSSCALAHGSVDASLDGSHCSASEAAAAERSATLAGTVHRILVHAESLAVTHEEPDHAPHQALAAEDRHHHRR